MKPWLGWAAIALLAFAAGGALWWSGRPAPRVTAPTIGPAALYATSFRDLQGRQQPLGQFQGRVLVLNFWATWCAPCREEMPGFDRLARKWSERSVAFVGVSQESAEAIAKFQRDLAIGYPLWQAGAEATELSRRLGNSIDGLPFTAVLSASGAVVAAKVGPYEEGELDQILSRTAAKR